MAESLTQAEAHRLFEYRDGALYWKPRVMSRGRPSVKEGRLVGVDDGRGYMRLQVNHRKYYVHQIVFLLHHGFLPKCIDHADGNQKNLIIFV